MRYALSLVLVTLLLSPTAFAADKKGGSKKNVFDGTIMKIYKNRVNFDAVDANGKAVHGYAYFDKTVKFHLDLATLLRHRSRLDCRRLIVTHMNEDMLRRRDALDVETAEDGKVVDV